MFVRFREAQRRLRLSLVETHRQDGQVRQEHVDTLSSLPLPSDVADRIEFWGRLHERLGRLSHRLNPEAQRKILGEVHARIPMVTPDEQRALQLENARTEERFWSDLHGMHA